MQKETIYFIQPVELIGTNRYKIGRSKQSDLKRCKTGYRKGTRFIRIAECTNSDILEKNIKEHFNKKYKLVAGYEYFEGNEYDMITDFNNIVNEYFMKYEIKPNEICKIKPDEICKIKKVEDDCEDIYLKYIEENTEKSTRHISAKDLYNDFKIWYTKTYNNNILPDNRKFVAEIKKYIEYKSSVKINNKNTSGFKCIKLKIHTNDQNNNNINIQQNTDIYLNYLNNNTEKTICGNISCIDLYNNFKCWYEKNKINDILPTNRQFIIGIKKYIEYKKSVKINKNKITSGFRFIKLKSNIE